MMISGETAAAVFRTEAHAASRVSSDPSWIDKIERLSSLCEQGGSSTHIAFLGTSILARSVDDSVDLRAIKPTHAEGNPHAYSARTLCHGVLVPLAAELGVNIGVSGREPLNNQPYFRMTSLGDGTPVRGRARPAFDYMIELIDELQGYTATQAQAALMAFIEVRRRFQVVYAEHVGAVAVAWPALGAAIATLVQEDSEGGRRAQAAVAGMFDLVAGPENVESGRINDPSRHYPGDVAVRDGNGRWAKAVEVRDKPVAESDVYIFGQSCLSRGVREAGVVLASPFQARLDDQALVTWAATKGLGLTLLYGWDVFVDQVLFWAEAPKAEGVAQAVGFIESRLIAVEASPESVARWHDLTRF